MSEVNSNSKERKTGKIKFLDSRKGFGFVKPDDGSRDVFLSVNRVPENQLTNDLRDQRCSFTVEQGPKGLFVGEFTLL